MEQDILQTAISHHLAGRLLEAEATYRQVLQRNPNDINARNNLGVVLKGLGRIDEAIVCYRETIRIQPDCAEAFYNLANVQRGVGRLDEAAESYQRVLKLKGDYADAWNNLGLVRAEQGRLDEAIANCRLAIKLKPDTPDGYINLLYALYHHPNYDARQLLEETRVWGRRQATDGAGYRPVVEPSAGRRLRVGYLSSFFGMCADAHFILPLLAGHDRNQFEVFCFTKTVRDDEVSARMRSHCDHWVDIRAAPIQRAVEFIRGQKLDVLVVMSRPADECLKIMASRCAPVQMTWLTFASCTSGLENVDCRISDAYLDPVEGDDAYVEKTVRLPETAWCYDPMENVPAVQALSALANQFVTFGSLNRVSGGGGVAAGVARAGGE
jgi:protein O-GlcNAc transferase